MDFLNHVGYWMAVLLAIAGAVASVLAASAYILWVIGRKTVFWGELTMYFFHRNEFSKWLALRKAR